MTAPMARPLTPKERRGGHEPTSGYDLFRISGCLLEVVGGLAFFAILIVGVALLFLVGPA